MITITTREKEAQNLATIIRDTFGYTGPVHVTSEVEGAPRPTDAWVIRAQVTPMAQVFVKIPAKPKGQERAILAMIIEGEPEKGALQKSTLREALLLDRDPTVFPLWVSRAWTLLNQELAQARLDKLRGIEPKDLEPLEDPLMGFPWGEGETVLYEHTDGITYEMVVEFFRDERRLRYDIRNTDKKQAFVITHMDDGWAWSYTGIHSKARTLYLGSKESAFLWADAAEEMFDAVADSGLRGPFFE